VGEPVAAVMRWRVSHRADPPAVRLADRHYSRQAIGSPQFVPPGRCVVLVTPTADALWVTSWPYADWVRHAWGGAWVCSLFRNESPHRSSDLIREAVAATCWVWPTVPALGMVTFIDAEKIRPKRDPGRCFRRAGFLQADPPRTVGGLIALQLAPTAMPAAEPPLGAQFWLMEGLDA
jgi:hypothetical protein